jgi:hypothetical protein
MKLDDASGDAMLPLDGSSEMAKGTRDEPAREEQTPATDFVITWVDGLDPAHIAARARFGQDDAKTHKHATDETRFRNNGEIYYLIASILKYAPFIRRIYLITDNQKPVLLDSFAEAGLCDPTFIELVSHDSIFDGLNVARPTFNARVIEAAMWRVPGLSEHFIYANDDMFLNAPVSTENFFRHGRPVQQGEMLQPSNRRLKMRLRKFAGGLVGWEDRRPKHWIAQEVGSALAGMADSFFHVLHRPHPLRRSVLEAFHAGNPDVLPAQMKYRFRNVAQYNPVSLSYGLELVAGTAIVEPPAEIAYMTPEKPRSPASFLEMVRRKDVLFGCVQSMEQFSPAIRARTCRVLREKFADELPGSVLDLARDDA